MSTANTALIQRLFEEIYSQGNLTVADEIVAADYVSHNPAPGEAPGREGLKASVAYLRRAFADLHVTIEDQVTEGDSVTTRFIISGVHEGDYSGIPPSGHPFLVNAITIHRICNGQIVESWLNWDTFSLIQQLKAVHDG